MDRRFRALPVNKLKIIILLALEAPGILAGFYVDDRFTINDFLTMSLLVFLHLEQLAHMIHHLLRGAHGRDGLMCQTIDAEEEIVDHSKESKTVTQD